MRACECGKVIHFGSKYEICYKCRVPTYPCLTCGSPIKGSPKRKRKRFCSALCKENRPLAVRLVQVNCCVCGTSVKRTEKDTKKRSRFCCSSDCQRKLVIKPTEPQELELRRLQGLLVDLRKSLRKCKSKLIEVEECLSRSIVKIVNCARCGKETTRKKFCSDLCNNRHKKRRRRAAMANAITNHSINEYDIYNRDKNRCWICKRKVVHVFDNTNPRGATLDHVIPITKGGKHEADNLACCCRECNCKKNAKSYTLF